jgi:hypothetical protein
VCPARLAAKRRQTCFSTGAMMSFRVVVAVTSIERVPVRTGAMVCHGRSPTPWKYLSRLSGRRCATGETVMTMTERKAIKPKVGLLELGRAPEVRILTEAVQVF